MPFYIPGGVQSAVDAANLDLGERQFIGIFDDSTKEYIGCKIAKIYPGTTGTTPYEDVPFFPAFTEAFAARLAAMMTNGQIVDLINAELGTDLANIVTTGGLNYAAIATILDAGTGSDRWRNAAVSIYGNPADSEGDLSVAPASLDIAATIGLQTALDGKSAVGHGHPTSQITGLDAALAAKVSTTLLGAVDGVATLGSDGKLTAAQVPTSVGNDVSSVFGRTGAVVAVAGDYTATTVGVSSHGFVSTTTSLQAFLNELIDEVIPLTQKGAASGVCPLNSSSKIDSSYLATADSAWITETALSWITTSVTPSMTTTPGELSSQQKRFIVDLSNASKMRLQSYLAAGTIGSTGTKMYIEYATAADSYASWTLFGVELMLDGTGGTGFIYTALTNIPSGAKTATTILRLMLVGGSSTTATIANVNGIITQSVPINTGTPTGAQMVTAIDAALGSTAWQGGPGSLSDGSVTLAKLVTFATQTAPLRKSAGTGALEVGTQSDWRTFLDVTNTVFGRKGTVVATTGDYTADQITQTSTNAFVTATQKSALLRMVTSTTFTTSDIIGFNEAWVTFGGTGTLTLTGTLSNGAIANFISIYNQRTVAINLVPQSGRTMAKLDGTVLTTYSLAAKASVCALLVGTVWVLQV